jgi:CheY-like chemotaxis protein
MSTPLNNIWIVDDDKLYTLLLTKTLNKLEASKHIATYSDGHSAIEALKAIVAANGTLPELIFLDINMSIMDGWEFMEEYKRLKADKNMSTIIYVASSSISNDDIAKAKSDKEIKDYIIKPIHANTILGILNRVREQMG